MKLLSCSAAIAALILAGGGVSEARPKAKSTAPDVPVAVAPTPADFHPLDPDDMLVVDTNKGRIIVAMTAFIAPQHVARIKTLAHQHFYDGLAFFRVVEDFMDQTGDPNNRGDGGSTYPNLQPEFSFRRDASLPFVEATRPDDGVTGFIGVMPITSQPDDLMMMTADAKVTAWPLFCPGTMGMARSNEPDTGNSQFFFMRAAYPALDKKYTAWGRVVLGEDVVRSIKIGEPAPDPQDKMLTVRLGSDLPADQRPKVYVLDTRTAAFRTILDKAKADKGADFSVCDVDIPAELR